MRRVSLFGVVLVLGVQTAGAQSTSADYRDEFLTHFERSTRKVVSLAEAMPESLYAWSPGEGVMSVGRVYAHIARYNYYYLESSLSINAPDAIDVDHLEEITGKARILRLLKASAEHVRQSTRTMTAERLSQPARLYGRQVASWAVLFQLLAHMNEHVGQSVAYARMNRIVPPWSR